MTKLRCVAAFCTAALCLTAPAVAQSADCVEKTRSNSILNGLKVETIVENQTKGDLSIQIFKGLTNPKTLGHEIISPGSKMSRTVKDNSPAIRAVLQASTSTAGECQYRVVTTTSSQRGDWGEETTWKEYTCAKLDAAKITVKCEKSFNPDNGRWKTKLTVKDQ